MTNTKRKELAVKAIARSIIAECPNTRTTGIASLGSAIVNSIEVTASMEYKEESLFEDGRELSSEFYRVLLAGGGIGFQYDIPTWRMGFSYLQIKRELVAIIRQIVNNPHPVIVTTANFVVEVKGQ